MAVAFAAVFPVLDSARSVGQTSHIHAGPHLDSRLDAYPILCNPFPPSQLVSYFIRPPP